jgi:hypothetical protein
MLSEHCADSGVDGTGSHGGGSEMGVKYQGRRNTGTIIIRKARVARYTRSRIGLLRYQTLSSSPHHNKDESWHMTMNKLIQELTTRVLINQ